MTQLAAQLKINPLYAVLSGFEFGDTPGVGTFYDFLNRSWDSDSNNFFLMNIPSKRKKSKNQSKKEQKRIPLKK